MNGAFVNSRGRCGGKAAMQAVHRSLYELSPHCMLLCVAEADFRRSETDEHYDFPFYKKCWAVRRHKLRIGRAMKVFIAKELEDCLESVHWLNRSVVLRFCSSCHFAHQDDWEPCVEEVLPWLQHSGWRSLLLGDLNVESRFEHQLSED